MDISQDDAILTVSYENSRLELFDLFRMKNEIEEMPGEQNMLMPTKYLVTSYKLKQSRILCLKFTYENLLLGIALHSTDDV
jgi:hypothetical protein